MANAWRNIGSLEDIPLDDVQAVAADVDHTVYDFGPAHAAAVAAVGRLIDRRAGEALRRAFDLVLEGTRRIEHKTWELRDEYAGLLSSIAAKQGVDPAGAKKWSRETWLQVASDRDGWGFTQGDVVEARDLYWDVLGSSGGLYPDAETFLWRLRQGDTPLVLMTASDSVLRPTDEGGFSYDAEYAKGYKLDRLGSMGIDAAEIVVGDPHDKPSTEFFDLVDEAVRRAGARRIDRVVAVGDSPKGDVKVPSERGYRSYLIERH